MSTRAEPESYQNMVAEALAHMQAAIDSAPQYEVDRTGGHWVVRRAATAESLFPTDAVSAALNKLAD